MAPANEARRPSIGRASRSPAKRWAIERISPGRLAGPASVAAPDPRSLLSVSLNMARFSSLNPSRPGGGTRARLNGNGLLVRRSCPHEPSAELVDRSLRDPRPVEVHGLRHSCLRYLLAERCARRLAKRKRGKQQVERALWARRGSNRDQNDFEQAALERCAHQRIQRSGASVNGLLSAHHDASEQTPDERKESSPPISTAGRSGKPYSETQSSASCSSASAVVTVMRARRSTSASSIRSHSRGPPASSRGRESDDVLNGRVIRDSSLALAMSSSSITASRRCSNAWRRSFKTWSSLAPARSAPAPIAWSSVPAVE